MSTNIREALEELLAVHVGPKLNDEGRSYRAVQKAREALAAESALAATPEPCPHQAECLEKGCNQTLDGAPCDKPAAHGPFMHKPSGFVFDQVLAAAVPDDLMPLTPPATPEREKTTLQWFEELNAECLDDPATQTPIERLRFFCSLALNSQDWLDVEPFFDALSPPPADRVKLAQECKRLAVEAAKAEKDRFECERYINTCLDGPQEREDLTRLAVAAACARDAFSAAIDRLAAAPQPDHILFEHFTTALRTIRDMPMEEQDNQISASMRMVAGWALAPEGNVTGADIAWAKKVFAENPPTMLNGLTEEETSATASVAGLEYASLEVLSDDAARAVLATQPQPVSAPTEQEERKAFTDWYRRTYDGRPVRIWDRYGDFASALTEVAWAAWQAGRSDLRGEQP